LGQTAVEVRGVTKIFRLYQEKYTSLKERVIHGGRVPYESFAALDDITFEVEQGHTLGLLGHNGSGKSTLLKCIAGILTPTRGEVAVRGRVAAMLEVGAGFHPDLSGRDNIYLNATLFGLSRKEVDARLDDIIEFSELGPFIENQVKFYSSGMYARLGFAVAVNMDPDVLLVDEVLAVGDARFQAKCIAKIREFQAEGRTIIFVSHSPELVRAVCDSAFVLDHGRLVGGGPTQDAITLLTQLQLAGSGLGSPAPVIAELDEAPRQVVVGSLQANGVAVEQPVGLNSGDPLELRFVLEERSGQPTPVDVEIALLAPQGSPVLVASSREMGMDPFVVHGSAKLLVQIAQLPVAAGVYQLGVSVSSAMTGELLERAQWDTALRVHDPRRGLSGMLSTDVTFFAE
jgi:ABC-type polysaccharide/polyol phosphate transport system ATPase subunit